MKDMCLQYQKYIYIRYFLLSFFLPNAQTPKGSLCLTADTNNLTRPSTYTVEAL